MSDGRILILNMGVLLAAVIALWVISWFKEDVSIVDIFWGLGFVIVVWLSLARTGQDLLGHLWLAIPTTLWGIRLAGYLAWRNLGRPEDHRYRAMRERIGPRFRWISLYYVFVLQGVLIWVVALPIQLAPLAAGPEPGHQVTVMRIIGLASWIIGMFFETTGDIQLARFKANPDNHGKIMDRGLWRYTRHPNYFGDFMVWWGLFAIAMASPAGLAGRGFTVVGPLVMSILLIRVSGVALLEQSLRDRRPGYADYIQRTSAFWPWPARK